MKNKNNGNSTQGIPSQPGTYNNAKEGYSGNMTAIFLKKNIFKIFALGGMILREGYLIGGYLVTPRSTPRFCTVYGHTRRVRHTTRAVIGTWNYRCPEQLPTR